MARKFGEHYGMSSQSFNGFFRLDLFGRVDMLSLTSTKFSGKLMKFLKYAMELLESYHSNHKDMKKWKQLIADTPDEYLTVDANRRHYESAS